MATSLTLSLRRDAVVTRTLSIDGQPLASIEPTSPRFAWTPSALEHARFRLSPFACCRREGDAMMVESPLAPARVVLFDPRALLVLGALAMTPAAEASLSGPGGL